MQLDAHPFSKPERQRLIGSLVSRKRIGTQLELRDALAGAGCRVTQATISRDIRELGLEKSRDSLGRPRYAPPQRSRRDDPGRALSAVLSQFGRRATPAQTIVVLVSELGTAPAIARAIDRIRHPLVVGTLAGDDTVLVVTAKARDAAALAGELGALMGS
jgi:transcriptional regulator of arginine metabolism